MNDDLHARLTALAEDVTPVDLHSRVLATSRKLAWQRSALAGSVALTIVGVIAGSALALTPTLRAVTPADSPSPAATLPTPTPTPAAALSTSPGPTGTAIDLANSTLDIPAWPGDNSAPCQGTKTLTDGVAPGATSGPTRHIALGKVVTGDVNHDGKLDTVAVILCRTGQNPLSQLVAFEAGPSGGVRTIGRIVGPAPHRTTSELATIFDVKVTDEGDIQAEVGDFTGLLDQHSAQYSQHQFRTYRWDGQKFAQHAGPTSFAKNPNFSQLIITTTDLQFGPLTGGQRTGTLKVTVHNDGAGPAWGTKLAIWAPGFVLRTGPGWDTCTPIPSGEYRVGAECVIGKLQPGETRTFTYGFSTGSANVDPAGAETYVVGRARDGEDSEGARPGSSSEAKFNVTAS
ncbi:hypothetical protein AB0M43_29920 [Longispora sp. NPDC051575]|uniref:hypothetical protein n=1 Tax=Longispora sp. NPDC051575 TaxID=3154943 RepID=UPI00342FDED7